MTTELYAPTKDDVIFFGLSVPAVKVDVLGPSGVPTKFLFTAVGATAYLLFGADESMPTVSSAASSGDTRPSVVVAPGAPIPLTLRADSRWVSCEVTLGKILIARVCA